MTPPIPCRQCKNMLTATIDRIHWRCMNCDYEWTEPYMPVPRCDGCRFWNNLRGPDKTIGQCQIMYEGSRTKIWPEYRDRIYTTADFGCVQLEAK